MFVADLSTKQVKILLRLITLIIVYEILKTDDDWDRGYALLDQINYNNKQNQQDEVEYDQHL